MLRALPHVHSKSKFVAAEYYQALHKAHIVIPLIGYVKTLFVMVAESAGINATIYLEMRGPVHFWPQKLYNRTHHKERRLAHLQQNFKI